LGGLGSAVSEFLSEEHPVRLRRIGLKDAFGCSGAPEELMRHYGFTAADIVKTIKETLASIHRSF
jgi:transketolase